ncbi:hypothetical protein Mboo_0752 [Methanoregula boonei 6A8]|uniref:Uncharacterized protein n=1 Tax=Methanoregula boonei (strain DSM 21154 / JCM 14090 / 6A8) TaxID=456442 RepID=A7I6A9_METB6|nr:hypothetical protein Mboo_0752 [Methanoregula boonei 6A8]
MHLHLQDHDLFSLVILSVVGKVNHFYVRTFLYVPYGVCDILHRKAINSTRKFIQSPQIIPVSTGSAPSGKGNPRDTREL